MTDDETSARPRSRSRGLPLTVDRVIETAFELVQAEGFDALTMRRIAAALETGPASLYAHVRNKADLDGLLIGRLATRVAIPEPDSGPWTTRFIDVCARLRDLYLAYPGISRAALSAPNTGPETLRINEALLAILLSGGVPAQSAVWAIDAALLYVGAYTFEASLRTSRDVSATEIAERLERLPADHFPLTIAHVTELTSGTGRDRFEFALDLLLTGLPTGRSSHHRSGAADRHDQD